MDDEGRVVFTLYDAGFTTINFIPKSDDELMQVKVDFRLINKLET